MNTCRAQPLRTPLKHTHNPACAARPCFAQTTSSIVCGHTQPVAGNTMSSTPTAPRCTREGAQQQSVRGSRRQGRLFGTEKAREARRGYSSSAAAPLRCRLLGAGLPLAGEAVFVFFGAALAALAAGLAAVAFAFGGAFAEAFAGAFAGVFLAAGTLRALSVGRGAATAAAPALSSLSLPPSKSSVNRHSAQETTGNETG